MTQDELILITLGVYALIFVSFTILVGTVLRSRGRVFLDHTFQRRPAVADAVQFLLNLGFYVTCLGLLLWNVGVEPSGTWVNGASVFTVKDLVESVALRLGISIFVVSAFHSMNILILSVLNRNNGTEPV